MSRAISTPRALSQEPLDQQVRRLLNSRKGQWKVIAAATGISYSWVAKFAQGHISNPGYQRLRNLRNHLVAEELAGVV